MIREIKSIELLVCLEQTLAPKQFQLIRLRYFDNYSVEDTCYEMHISSIRKYYNIFRQLKRNERLKAMLHEFRNTK